jgi:hypothetical protein
MSILKAAQADRHPPQKPLPPDTQKVCIDLPGEVIRCHVYKPKLQIMLRKHRDVIFDIELFKGMQYTVEADQSDFYNARDKKIVLVKSKQKATFKDGERMHLHVGRAFKGHLILKANGKVLARYTPNELDTKRYDDEPATKPAPLIVVMKNEPAPKPTLTAAPPTPVARSSQRLDADWQQPYAPLEFSKPRPASEDQSMHVVEIKPDDPNLPKEVADFFKKGGEQTAMDTTGILTRNWLWAQIVGGAGYVSDNKQWIKELWKEKFYLQRVMHKSGPKVYVVFKGNQGLREFITAARYGASHAKVIAITSGAGTVQGLRHAAWEAAKGSVKKAGLLALVFTVTLDTAEWLADYEERDPATGKPKKDIFDLCFKIGIDVAKAVVSAVIGSLLMGITAGLFITAGIALPAILIVVGAIAFAVGVGYAIDLLDKQTGATDKLNGAIRKAVEHLGSKMPGDYSGYDRSIETALQFGLGA